MRRFWAVSTSLFIVSTILFGGCTSQPNAKEDKKDVVVTPIGVQIAEKQNGKDKEPKENIGGTNEQDVKQLNIEAGEKKEKYDLALNEALRAQFEGKLQDALAAFETAQTFQDSELVRVEIAKLKQRIEQEDLATNTIKNIETVLSEGKGDVAVNLVTQAMKEFGETKHASRLIQLRLQAEALLGVQKKEDPDARYTRFLKEGDSAVAEKNLRAAALAYEQALQSRDDADLKQKYDGIREKLDKYDALRQKAVQLRQDPAQIDAAIEALREAKDTWDTLQVRQELDDAILNQQARPENNVSVADFEVRNDVGLANAGIVLADELLPLLKQKYDLVERDQLKKVIAELNLEKGVPDDPAQQQQIGNLAKVRYLVVGSIHRVAAVTINARLVDVKTGLVMQTAKVIAPSMEQAVALIPDLAKQLMMSDKEKMDLDQKTQQNAGAEQPKAVPDNADLPPVPQEPTKDDAPPLMLIKADMAAPGGINVQANVFRQFAPPPPNFVPVAPPQLEIKIGNRLRFAAVEMGDFLFRAGRVGEAQKQFEFAMTLDPDNVGILVRLDQCRQQAPPLIPVFVRPRVAVLTFSTLANPDFFSPSLSIWTPANLAPYLGSRYDVVDPTTIYWFMARSGLTMQDLAQNPNALRWLSRAVGVRYFVFGSHTEAPGIRLNVNTYLVDAESGYLEGAAQINVQTPFELKLRMQELAQLTLMTRADRNAILASQQQYDNLIRAGLLHMNKREFDLAVTDFGAAKTMRPNSVQAEVYYYQALRFAHVFRFEIERRRLYEAQQAAIAAAQQRQLLVAQNSDQACQTVVAAAAVMTAPQREATVQLRIRAQEALVVQAKFALGRNQFGLSVNLFQGAADVAVAIENRSVGGGTPPPSAPVVIFQELARARVQADKEAQLRAVQQTAALQRKLLEKRDRQLQEAQMQLLADQKALRKAMDAVAVAQAQRDDTAYRETFKQGQKLLGEKKYEAALTAFQAAQRFKHTPEVSDSIDTVLTLQAETRSNKALIAELKRRKDSENQAKLKSELYEKALEEARKEMRLKNYESAHAKFETAGHIYRTDAVLTGLKQVEQARLALDRETQKVAAEAKKAARINDLLTQGSTALKTKDYSRAAGTFREAKSLDPNNPTVLAGLLQAEQAQNHLLADANRVQEDQDRKQNFQRLLKSGNEFLNQKQYNAAIATLNQAKKLNPADKQVLAALAQAEEGRGKTVVDAKTNQIAETYQKKMNEGWLALSGKRYDVAIKAYTEAQLLMPSDKAAREFLQEAQTSKKAAERVVAEAAAKRADEQKKTEEVQKVLTQGRTALLAKNLPLAAKLFAQAQTLRPDHPDVSKALHDLEQAQVQAVAAETQKKRARELIATGHTALKASKLDEAEKAFKSASLLEPTNPEVVKGLRDVDQARNFASMDKQRLAEYQTALSEGQKALTGKHYKEAASAFEHALKVMPNDIAASKLLQQAQQGLNLEGKVMANFQKAVDDGQTAMKNQKYAEAVTAFKEAVRLHPTDANTQKLLMQAQQAAQGTEVQANYLKAITAGEKALAAQQFPAAIKSFGDALKLIPNDQKALQFLKAAQQQAGEIAQKQTKFQEHMKAAQTSMTGKKYEEAVKAYGEAMKLMPKDVLAQRGLQDATRAWETSKVKMPPILEAPKTYEQAMKMAAGLEKEQKYGEAATAFQDALKFRPADPLAKTGVTRNQFNLHIVQGQQYLDTMMYVEAVREYEAALKLSPNNAQVQKLLQKAKNKGK